MIYLLLSSTETRQTPKVQVSQLFRAIDIDQNSQDRQTDRKTDRFAHFGSPYKCMAAQFAS